VLGCPPNELSEHLAEALDAGLLHEGMGKLEFAHDRIREAAYALIPPREQTMEHLHVGRMLQAFFGPEAAKTDRVFQVVTHLNHGIDTITDDDERSELRALNLAAGRRARSGVAYESARTYFVHAVELLPEDAFASSYEEAF